MLNDRQEQILEFFVRQQDYAGYSIQSLYPFSDYLLGKYGESLNWCVLSDNPGLVKDIAFIEKYKNQINWKVLSESHDVPWTEPFVDKYKKRLNWSGRNISDTEAGDSFSRNSHFLWTDEFIQKYKKYIDWEDFSQNSGSFWTEEMVDKYAHRMDWEYFSPNGNKPFSNEFIEKYLHKYKPPYHAMGIIEHPDLIEKYANSIQWWVVSYNTCLPVDKAFFDKWNQYLNWCAVAANGCAIDSFAKFELFFGETDYPQKYRCLSSDWVIDWSEDLLRKYINEWDWKALSFNPGLPWSMEMMERFEDRLVFGKHIPDPDGESYTVESGLETNSGLPWSMELIKKYEKKWDYMSFPHNFDIWKKAFAPHVNEEMVELFLRIVL